MISTQNIQSLRLLGAQIVGGEGVDKRIDVLAMAIRAKMTALELTELDLSYAPPYSSAKDPVNMAGFMIEDLESGKVQQFHWNDVEDLPCDGSATLLDVRTDFSIVSQHHRTTVAYFLNHGKWNDSALQKALKSSIVELIYQ